MPKEIYLRQGSIVAVVSDNNNEDYWLAEIRRAGAEKMPSIRWLDRNPRRRLEYSWCIGNDVLDRQSILDLNVKFNRRVTNIDTEEDKRLRAKRKQTPIDEPEPEKVKIRVKPTAKRQSIRKATPPPPSSSSSSSSSGSSTAVTAPKQARPPSPVDVVPESDNSFFSPLETNNVASGCKVSAFPKAPLPPKKVSEFQPPISRVTTPTAAKSQPTQTFEKVTAPDDTFSSLPTVQNNSPHVIPVIRKPVIKRVEAISAVVKTPENITVIQSKDEEDSSSPLTLDNLAVVSSTPSMKDNMKRVQTFVESQKVTNLRTRRKPLTNSVGSCLEGKDNSAWILVSNKNRLISDPLPNEMVTHITNAMGEHRGWIKSCETMTTGEGYVVLFNGVPSPPLLRGLVQQLQSLVGVCVDGCTVTAVIPVVLNNTDFEATHRSSASRSVQNRNTLFFANSGFSPWQTLSHCVSASSISFAVVNTRSDGGRGAIVMVTFSEENIDVAALAVQMCNLGHRHDQVWLVGKSKTNIRQDIPPPPPAGTTS